MYFSLKMYYLTIHLLKICNNTLNKLINILAFLLISLSFQYISLKFMSRIAFVSEVRTLQE